MPISADLMEAKDHLSASLLKVGEQTDSNFFAPVFTNRLNKAIENANNNVHAVGVGKKIIDGKVTKTQAICIYVTKKIHSSLLPKEARLPEMINGIPTDIIEAPPAFLKACTNDRHRIQRPMIGGISIGHKDVTFGTIGYFCRSTKAGDDQNKIYILSNNHVLANVDSAFIGDNIYQPGPNDGGISNTTFAAKFHRAVPINFSQYGSNRVDAAIGEVLSTVVTQNSICQIGSITGIGQVLEDMIVRKHGAMSGFTEGFVRHEAVDVVVTVQMDVLNPVLTAKFVNQMRIDRIPAYPYFGIGGDSGSLIVNKETNEAVGLFFAAPEDGSYGYANHITNVINELEIQLL